MAKRPRDSNRVIRWIKLVFYYPVAGVYALVSRKELEKDMRETENDY